MAVVNTVFRMVADNKTQRAFKEVDKSLDSAQKGISNLSGKIAGLVGAAGMGLMIKTQLDAAKETQAWSNALGVQVSTLSAWQFAAKEANLEGDKMADIMKDVSEKIGDAFANNAGEAKEVMERLNLSMKDMVELSPDQQILAIANSLDKVGTRAEKIQILEALGSDLSLMLPLLENNAAGFHELAVEAEEAGAIMTEADAQGMKVMNDTLRKIEASNAALSKSFTLAFGESLADSVSYISSTVIPAFSLLAERIGIIDMNIASMDETQAGVRIAMLTEEIETMQEVADRRRTFFMEGWADEAEQEVSAMKGQVDQLNERIAALKNTSASEGAPAAAPVVGGFVPTEGGGGDDKAAAAEEKEKARLARQFERLNVAMMSERDALAFHHEEKQVLLDQSLAQGVASEAQHKELSLQLEQEHQVALSEIIAEEQANRALTEEEQMRLARALQLQGEQEYYDQLAAMAETAAQQKIDIAQQTFGTLAVLTASSSKKMFNIGKASAVASAVINTYQAVTKTMAATPYPWNIPLAVAQGAAGLVQVQKIKSQKFSGARELGGDVMPGKSYLVGERGPEIATFPTAGNITPNNQIGGSSNIINVQVMASDAQSFDDQLGRSANKIWNIIMDKMNEEGVEFA